MQALERFIEPVDHHTIRGELQAQPVERPRWGPVQRGSQHPGNLRRPPGQAQHTHIEPEHPRV